MAVDQNSGKLESPLQDSTEDYEHLLDDYSHFVPPGEGEVLEGRVLKVTPQEVIVDFGYKSEGLVPIEQFRGYTGEI
jgi:small subunit ribosomal protein S1